MKLVRKWWQAWIGVAVLAWGLTILLLSSGSGSGPSLWLGLAFEGSIGSIASFMAIKRFRENF